MRNPLKAYHEATKSWPAAVLLFQIAYWDPKATIRRDGFTWIAKSAADWQHETDLTPQQYKDAIALLRQLSLVVTERFKFGGQPITHLRLTDRGQALVRPAAKGPKAPTTQGLETPTTQGLETPSHKQGTTTRNYKQEEDCVLPHAGPSGGHFKQVPGKTELEPENHLELADQTDSGKDVPKKLHKPQAHLPLEQLWQHTVGELEDAYVPPLTVKQRGQLRHLARRCPKGKAAQILEYCLRKWPLFTQAVKSDAGLSKAPAKPHVGFLLKHVHVAANLYLGEAAKPKVNPPPAQSIPKITPPNPDEKEGPASQEEALGFFYGKES